VRPDEIFVGALRAAHERRRDLVLAGTQHDRFRLDRIRPASVSTARRRRLVREQGDALAIDGDVDVFVARAIAAVEGDLEDIFAVGREHMIDDHPAARAVGRTLDMIPGMLRDVGGVGVGVVDRARGAVAHRHPRDIARGVQIGFEERRRQRLLVGDVVKVRALGVERQPFTRVDLEVEQLMNRVGVLGPVEPLERAAAGVRLGHRGDIDRRFERGDERRMRRRVRARGTGRRHHAGLQLEDHLFGDGGVVGGLGNVKRLEREAAHLRLALFVVAGDAVALDDRVVVLGGHGAGNFGGDGNLSRRSRGLGHRGRVGAHRRGLGRGGLRRRRALRDNQAPGQSKAEHTRAQERDVTTLHPL
jgi:hypothetical protein